VFAKLASPEVLCNEEKGIKHISGFKVSYSTKTPSLDRGNPAKFPVFVVMLIMLLKIDFHMHKHCWQHQFSQFQLVVAP